MATTLAAPEALDEPGLGAAGLRLSVRRAARSGGNVRTRHGARFGELEQLAAVGAGRRGDLARASAIAAAMSSRGTRVSRPESVTASCARCSRSASGRSVTTRC